MATDKRFEAVSKIAAKILDVETLVVRHSDSLDFHEVAVWRLEQALNAAYEAGLAAGVELAKSMKSKEKS